MSNEPTKAELYEQATEAEIEGRSSMSKEELAEALAEQEADEVEPDERPERDVQTPLAGITPRPAHGLVPAEPTAPLSRDQRR